MRISSGQGVQLSLQVDVQAAERLSQPEPAAPGGEDGDVRPNREFGDLWLRFLSSVATFDGRVDLSAVTSQYIGETERRIDAVFRNADRSDATLLFDEADSLFGRRSDVKDAHDR